MWTCDFDNIKKHWNRHTILLEVDTDGNIHLVIRRRPSICCIAQGSFVVLELSQVSLSADICPENKTDRPTCSVFPIRLRTCTKTFFTSCEMVSGKGTWYPGCPVFMRDRNVRSFTIWKGRLFSETQWMISALSQSKLKKVKDIKLVRT